MVEVSQFNQILKCQDVVKRRRKGNYDDTIYTYDIEVTSLFKISDQWTEFDYNIHDYSEIDKCSVPYVSMFGVNDKVYYFRDFMMFGDILEYIHDDDVTKIIYIHSLQYEFQFLLNIIESKNWTVTNMCSRDIRKPISFFIPEINIEFRCSYMLTNMSLENASKNYTNVRKKVGFLDYNVARSPLTDLNEFEKEYIEFDIICLYEIIKYYKNKHGHVFSIPLTITSEVRKELKKVVNYWYMTKMWSLVPDRRKYLIYMLCYSGGYTHANALYTNRIIKNVHSYDESSAYPAQFFKKFPDEDFRECRIDEYLQLPDVMAYIVHVKFYDVKCKYYNTYIQVSKMLNCDLNDKIIDNGRLMSCTGSFEMYLTEVDFELIKDMYKGECEILECWKAHKSYLDDRILRFILNCYKNKTTLKGREHESDEIEALYKASKVCCNSLYGISCQNILKQSSNFVNGQWQRFSFSDAFVDQKISEARESWSTLFQYTTGLYICSYNRNCLLRRVIQMDADVLYMDTDSIKYINDHDDIFEQYNADLIEQYKKLIEVRDEFTLDDFMPRDSKENIHLLGAFEREDDSIEFKTLGAKKYCVRHDDGLHLTVAGVSKSGVTALNDDLNNFKNGFVFDYYHSGKNVHYYIDDQPEIDFIDCQGNHFHSDLKYGIVLQPTTYKLGQTLEYELLVNYLSVKNSEVPFIQSVET